MQRSTLRTGSGRLTYSDLEPPFYAVSQEDFSGGRGGIALKDDPTEYDDATGLQSWIPKRLTLGPLVHTGKNTLYVESHETINYSETFYMFSPLTNIVAAQTFTLEDPISCQGVQVSLVGIACHIGLRARLCNVDVNGKPDLTSIIATGNWGNTSSETFSEWITFYWGSTSPALSANTQYAIVVDVTMPASAPSSRCSWSGDSESGYANGKGYLDTGSGWVEQTTDFSFRVMAVQSEETSAHLFMYRGLLYAIIRALDGSLMLRRGSLGVPTSATRESLTNTNADFTGYTGRIVKIVSGTGAGQWNEVESVSADTYTLNTTRPWKVIPDTTSVYAIPGDWEKILALPYEVKDVCVVDTIVYLTRGNEAVIKRYRWDTISGDEFSDDGENKADYLCLFRDSNNDPAIWRALDYEVSVSVLTEWGTDLTFGTAIRIGSGDSLITALAVYDDRLTVGKEDGLWAIEEETPRAIPVDFAALRDPHNCAGMVSWNLYLIFPLLHGVERMYGTQVDDFGPNLGRGLPDGRQGPVSALLPLPGMLLAAIDAGDNQSSILAYNQLGWHEIVRATSNGQRITSLQYESLPDGQIYLWWNEGAVLNYAWMSGVTFDRSRDSRADYASSGEIVTSWIGADLMDVPKLWHEVSIFWERNGGTVALSYQLDNENNSWTSVTATSATAEPIVRFPMGDISGHRIRLKLSLSRAQDDTTTPEITAWTIEGVGRIPPRAAFTCNVSMTSGAITLNGKPLSMDVESVIKTLDTWAGDTQPLTLKHVLPEFDNMQVFIEPTEVRVISWDGNEQRRVGAITLVQIG